MIETPKSGRLHIVLAGERNSGKSSLLNAIAGQHVAIVSDIPGTTTDSVSKAMEISGLGPCLLVDTAGLDDSGELGSKRVENSFDVIRAADIMIVVVDSQTAKLPDLPIPGISVVPVLNKCELIGEAEINKVSAAINKKYGKTPILASAHTGKGIHEIIAALQEAIPEDWDAPLITAGFVNEGDLVVLVMPQDKQAPKARLILPQQQTIRELLDRKCRIVCCTTDCLSEALDSLKEPPKVIITDSQDFDKVHKLTLEGTRLTSFSIMLAASKGDIDFFIESARKIDSLTKDSKVLIAEACTHVPASEDIGRVKIPGLLRKQVGEDLKIEIVSGRDFPKDLSDYDLVIHCGACMFNRRYVLARVQEAKRQGVPMTNYGVAIAYMNNLLYNNHNNN